MNSMWLKILPWATTVILGALLLNAHQTIGEEREACNTRMQAAIADAERTTREAQEANFARILEERDARDLANAAEIERLTRQRETIAAEVAIHEQEVRRLTLEAEFNEDDLPDSGACLNVFVLRDSVRGMQLGQSCPGAPASGDREGTLYSGSNSADAGESAFADITYSDVLNLWGRDRAALIKSNCQLRSIRNLTSGEQELDNPN